MTPTNFAYAAYVRTKFTYSEYILNQCEDEYNKQEVSRAAPRTLFVHSKFYMYSKEEQFLRRIFRRILHRYPRSAEVLLATSRMQRAELEPLDIISGLCSSNEFTSLKIPSALCNNAPTTVFEDIFAPVELTSMRWKDAFGGKTYVFSVGHNTECNDPLWADAGAAIHRCGRECAINGFDALAGGNPRLMHRNFYPRFNVEKKAQFDRVDAFVCSMGGSAASSCAELGRITTRKALIAYVTDARREDLTAIRYLNALREARWNESTLIAVSSTENLRFVKNQTGVQCTYLPQWCGGLADLKNATKRSGHGSSSQKGTPQGQRENTVERWRVIFKNARQYSRAHEGPVRV
jgi:hypothetical protein